MFVTSLPVSFASFFASIFAGIFASIFDNNCSFFFFFFFFYLACPNNKMCSSDAVRMPLCLHPSGCTH